MIIILLKSLLYQDMIDDHYLPFNNYTENELQKVCKTPPGKGPEKKDFDILAKKVVIGGLSPALKSNNTTTTTTLY
jgi:hypothetical protein